MRASREQDDRQRFTASGLNGSRRAGGRLVAWHLQELSEDWACLHNVKQLDGTSTSYLVGSRGIFAISTKAHAGIIPPEAGKYS